MRLMLATALLALALVAAGCSGGSSSDTSTSSESSETTQDTAVVESEDDFAGLVDIGGGRQMYMECTGTGSPTVVLV
jgi:ABC-type glycerol-3-phosphate transport system substrate-binding protein